MSSPVCVSVYIIGFLVFPFFYSFVDGWPFASPRLSGGEALSSILLCAIWPLALLVWLVCVWWCTVSWLGTSTRRLCDRLVKTLDHRASQHDEVGA